MKEDEAEMFRFSEEQSLRIKILFIRDTYMKKINK